jgi:hypothetical protein
MFKSMCSGISNSPQGQEQRTHLRLWESSYSGERLRPDDPIGFDAEGLLKHPDRRRDPLINGGVEDEITERPRERVTGNELPVISMVDRLASAQR